MNALPVMANPPLPAPRSSQLYDSWCCHHTEMLIRQVCKYITPMIAAEVVIVSLYLYVAGPTPYAFLAPIIRGLFLFGLFTVISNSMSPKSASADQIAREHYEWDMMLKQMLAPSPLQSQRGLSGGLSSTSFALGEVAPVFQPTWHQRYWAIKYGLFFGVFGFSGIILQPFFGLSANVAVVGLAVFTSLLYGAPIPGIWTIATASSFMSVCTLILGRMYSELSGLPSLQSMVPYVVMIPVHLLGGTCVLFHERINRRLFNYETEMKLKLLVAAASKAEFLSAVPQKLEHNLRAIRGSIDFVSSGVDVSADTRMQLSLLNGFASRLTDIIDTMNYFSHYLQNCRSWIQVQRNLHRTVYDMRAVMDECSVFACELLQQSGTPETQKLARIIPILSHEVKYISPETCNHVMFVIKSVLSLMVSLGVELTVPSHLNVPGIRVIEILVDVEATLPQSQIVSVDMTISSRAPNDQMVYSTWSLPHGVEAVDINVVELDLAPLQEVVHLLGSTLLVQPLQTAAGWEAKFSFITDTAMIASQPLLPELHDMKMDVLLMQSMSYLKKLRILVGIPDQQLAHGFNEHMAKYGCFVTLGHTCEEVLNLMSCQPHLVLLNERLMSTPGKEALAQHMSTLTKSASSTPPRVVLLARKHHDVTRLVEKQVAEKPSRFDWLISNMKPSGHARSCGLLPAEFVARSIQTATRESKAQNQFGFDFDDTILHPYLQRDLLAQLLITAVHNIGAFNHEDSLAASTHSGHKMDDIFSMVSSALSGTEAKDLQVVTLSLDSRLTFVMKLMSEDMKFRHCVISSPGEINKVIRDTDAVTVVFVDQQVLGSTQYSRVEAAKQLLSMPVPGSQTRRLCLLGRPTECSEVEYEDLASVFGTNVLAVPLELNAVMSMIARLRLPSESGASAPPSQISTVQDHHSVASQMGGSIKCDWCYDELPPNRQHLGICLLCSQI